LRFFPSGDRRERNNGPCLLGLLGLLLFLFGTSILGHEKSSLTLRLYSLTPPCRLQAVTVAAPFNGAAERRRPQSHEPHPGGQRHSGDVHPSPAPEPRVVCR